MRVTRISLFFIGLGLATLLSVDQIDAFIKAAVGIRIGYSPTEKGYGQPLQLSAGLHSKDPALKGQFMTGVHGAPPHAGEVGSARSAANGGAGLLRHLKILGVNLYLGGPKPNLPSHGHQNLQLGIPHGGIHLGQQQQQHLLRGQGPRGQYSEVTPQHQQLHGQGQSQGNLQGVGELSGIDSNNELGSGMEASSYSFPAGAEMFQPAASQYPNYNNINGIYQPQQVSPAFPQPTPSGPPPPPPQTGPQRPTGPHPPQNILLNRPGAGSPPPRQGFSLASLMRGPQWMSRPRYNIFRVPIRLQFGRTPPGNQGPHQQQGYQHQSPPQQQGPPQQHHHHPQGSIISAQSSPRMEYSTLFSTNPMPQTSAHNPPILAAMSASASSLPHFQPPKPQQNNNHHQQMMLNINQQTQGHSLANPFINYPVQTPPHQPYNQNRQQPPSTSPSGVSFASSDYYNTLNAPPQSPPHHHQPQQTFFPQPHGSQSQEGYAPQSQTMPGFSHGQHPRQQPPSQYQEEAPRNNGYDDIGGPFNMMPENIGPPQGFQYSHTVSSPIVSMGMKTYDDPPIMMDMGEQHQQRSHQGSQNQQQQQYQGDSGARDSEPREITEDEYKAFISAPTNTHTQHSTQIQAPSQMSYSPFHHQQQKQKIHRRRDHLGSSLRNWNSILDKHFADKKDISRSFDSAAESTKLSPTSTTTITTTKAEDDNGGTKKRVLRIRRTTTTQMAPTTTPDQ